MIHACLGPQQAHTAQRRVTCGVRARPQKGLEFRRVNDVNRTSAKIWLRSPTWDLALVAFCWLPFLFWVVFELGIGGSKTPERVPKGVMSPLAQATFVALGASYVHRHLTFILVYGDPKTFDTHRRAFTLAPLIVFGALGLLINIQGEARIEIPGLGFKMRPWFLALMITGAWNMWHTLMQRHGLARIYAAKLGRGLQERAHARRDLALLFGAGLLTACLTLRFRGDTMGGVRNARRMRKTLGPLVEGDAGLVLLLAASFLFAWLVFRWARAEFDAPIPLRERTARLTFWASTFALLACFVVWGPIVGYLVFGTAHALEYIAFFHHFGGARFRGDHEPSVASRLLARPMYTAPPMIVAFAFLYWATRDVSRTETYLVYYTGTSLLHFLYDGWIWKVRRPEVAQPLGVPATPT